MAITRTPDWSADLTDITGWGSTPPGGITDLFNGGLRERLRIELTNGSEVLFVVNNLAAWKEALKNTCP